MAVAATLRGLRRQLSSPGLPLSWSKRSASYSTPCTICLSSTNTASLGGSMKKHPTFGFISPTSWTLPGLVVRSFSTGLLCLGKDHSHRQQMSHKQQLKEDAKRKSDKVMVWIDMTPEELAQQCKRPVDDVYETMVILNIDELDHDMGVVRVAKRLGFKVEMIARPKIDMNMFQDVATGLSPGRNLQRRPPVVTIMGHVDHGKTTLLDALRQSEIVKQEHGGITQHIGAFVVSLDAEAQSKAHRAASSSVAIPNPIKPKLSTFEERIKNIEKLVTFLDTPGHSAFSAMRQRGANATDIVVLVVAADDGVMEQTIESIRYAQNANVPMIVAINKLDKIPTSERQKSIDRVKLGLNAQSVILEEDGGETLCVHISALKRQGLEDVKEAILALAETMEIRAPVDGQVEGVVIESTMDPKRGQLATVLVQKGTLKRGDAIVASDDCWAKVRSMYDEWSTLVNECPPGFPVQILGWRDSTLPEAGDLVRQVASEKHAKQILSESRKAQAHEKSIDAMKQHEEYMKEHGKAYKESLLERRSKGIRYGRMKNKGGRPKEMEDDPNEPFKVSILLKCDVHGSMEAILEVLGTYPNDLRKDHALLDIVNHGVGPISEADVEMVACFPNPIIYTFNLPHFIEPAAQKKANELGVPIKSFNVIYHLVRDVREILESKLPLIDQEVVLGEAQVQQEFLFHERRKKMAIAGCRCVSGSLKRKGALYKQVRGEEVVAAPLRCISLKHVKEDVQLITKGMECGILLEEPPGTHLSLRYQKGDRIVCYEPIKVKQRLKWSPKGF